MGSYVLGMGFTFDDSGEADDDTPGIPSAIATMERLIAENPKNKEVIFPYIGGKEVNKTPGHAYTRYVVNFGDRDESVCSQAWPELMAIVQKKVKPKRLEDNRLGYRRYWWQFAEKRVELYQAITYSENVLVTSAAAVTHHTISRLPANYVYSHKLIVFSDATSRRHGVMQSLFHEEWSRAFGATQGSADALTYNHTDVFLNFPFPDDRDECEILSAFSDRLSILMIKMADGPTAAYGKLHQPSEQSLDVCLFRQFHDEVNKSVAVSYGWNVIPTTCGFGLDYLDTEDDSLLPPDLQERIASGDLFFPTAAEACSFQAQLRRYGAVKASKKLPWRHRWPDAIRDDVLARLLALNAERYAEEQAMGLQGKGGKTPTKANARSSQRRGRAAKASQTATADSQQVEQMGLSL